jgi:acyl CoA:acetate/3-ketoacid CoA transferase beta subunit
MYENKYIGLNKFCLIGGNRINLRAGTNTDIGTGISNKFQATAENVWKGGLYNTTIMGTNSVTRLGINNDTTGGISSKNRLAVQLEAVGGANFCTVAAPESRVTEGPLLDVSSSLCMREAPVILDT